MAQHAYGYSPAPLVSAFPPVQGAAELSAVESQLAALRSAPWPATALGCSRAEVEEYADVVEAVEEVSGQLQVGRVY